MPTDIQLGTRAVELLIRPGLAVHCAQCDKAIKFEATKGSRQIVANIYKRSKWDRVEHFHPACYDDAGMPYGEADTTNATRLKRN